LTVRFGELAFAELETAAAAAGMGVTDYVRNAALLAARDERGPLGNTGD